MPILGPADRQNSGITAHTPRTNAAKTKGHYGASIKRPPPLRQLTRMLHKQSALKRLTSCGIEIAAFEDDKRSLPYPLSRRVAAGWTVIGRDGWPILD